MPSSSTARQTVAGRLLHAGTTGNDLLMKAALVKGTSVLAGTAEEVLRPALDWLRFVPRRHKAAAPPTEPPPVIAGPGEVLTLHPGGRLVPVPAACPAP